jgi:hypothetical protein
MACPTCGCKVSYQFDDLEDEGDDRLERCAACGEVFDLDDHAPEPDDVDDADLEPDDDEVRRRLASAAQRWPHADEATLRTYLGFKFDGYREREAQVFAGLADPPDY